MPTSSNSSFSKRARSYSRPQTPTSSSIHSRYGASPARSSKPKVLPFPDLPFRGGGTGSVSGISRDASRATSPTRTPAQSPPLHLSPRGSQSHSHSAIGLSSLGLEASGSGSGSGYFGSSEEVGALGTAGSGSGLTSPSGTGYNTPSGATTPRSPLGRETISHSFSNGAATSTSSSTNTNTHNNTRSRSHTTPDIMHQPRSNQPSPSRNPANPSASTTTSPPSLASSTSPNPQSILRNPIPPASVSTTRIEGFHPVPVSPTATIRPASVPTQINISASTNPVSHPIASSSTSTGLAPPIATSSAAPRSAPSNLNNKKLQPDTSFLSQAAALTPSTMPDAFGGHLYSSFLNGTCADVRIYVRKWGVGWAVHRMVLVQASFFHSMFLGGFSETGARRAKGKAKAIFAGDDEWSGEDVELQFDDPNITRAAFEICLSRLYSPFPELQFPVAFIPTPSQPLSPCFEGFMPTPLPEINDGLPPRTQLATPRLLLSLVATSIYLGHEAMLKQSLGMCLRTVGPATIGRYIAFAVGDGIGEEEWEGQNEEGARGLEDVARPLVQDEETGDDLASKRLKRQGRPSTDSNISVSPTRTDNEEEQKSEGLESGLGQPRRTSRPSPLSFDSNLEAEHDTSTDSTLLPHFYGFASDKLGESCSCFLTRWGSDILRQESKFASYPHPAPWSVFGQGGIHAKFIRALLSSDQFFVDGEMGRYKAARKVLELRRSGRDEMGDLGASPSSIMTGGGEEDEDEWEDEEEMEKVFTDGIYYTHMTFEDLSIIASDIDPHTGLPFAPLHVLQAAHWSAADLKSRVISATSGPGEPDPALGLCKPASELLLQNQKRRRPRASRNVTPSSEYGSFSSIPSAFAVSVPPTTPSSLYHPIPNDDTNRMGAAGMLFTSTSVTASTPMPLISGMPDLGPGPSFSSNPNPTMDGSDKPPKPGPQPHDERTYFGLSRQCRLLSDLPTSSPSSRWTKAEPFRFSVEFWDVHLLAERERAYSSTHFYAGSWFNVYVQTIRKKDKGTQLGVYLHRQSPGEPFPVPSSPGHRGGVPDTTTAGASPAGLVGGAPLGRSVTGHVTLGSPRGGAGAGEGGDLEVGQEVKEPYRDQRPITKAYFSITCASALGTCSIKFSSAPDSFTLSQSWGWKSSALRTEEYLATGNTNSTSNNSNNTETDALSRMEERLKSLGMREDGDAYQEVEVPKEGSLRASVVVGVV